MPPKVSFVTVPSPEDSFWQSTVELMAHQKEPRKMMMGGGGHPVAEAGTNARYVDFVKATNAVVHEANQVAASETNSPPRMSAVRYREAAGSQISQSGLADTVMNCASLAYRLAKARAFKTSDVNQLEAAFANFGNCDPFWIDCIEEYVMNYTLAGSKVARPKNPTCTLPYRIPANAVIAIFGDWGTGEPQAIKILSEIKSHKPDILMHLGDVYYSGTDYEMQIRFRDVITQVYGNESPRIFTLCGNHDMYSNGEAYYNLIKQIGQDFSYFSIENDDWRFIALDTGLNDCDPCAVATTATFLEPEEVRWLGEAVASAGDRKIALFTHHQPFSAYEPVAGQAVNEKLLFQLQPFLARITAWFWGHEHRLAVYDSFRGVERGRCLGHGAIPVVDDGKAEVIQYEEVPVHLEAGNPLSMGAEGGLLLNGYAILTLDAKNARVEYYRGGEPEPIWEEKL